MKYPINFPLPILPLLAALWLTAGCRNNARVQGETAIRRVTVTEARTQEVVRAIHTTGKLASRTEIRLSFKTGGIIAEIFVKEGAQVRAGTLLANLNLSEIRARKMQADEAYRKAERDYERVNNLYRDSVATLENLQDSRTALELARTNLEIAEFNLRYSSIKAPSDGTILLKMAEENEIVSQGQPVFLFASTGSDWVLRVSLTDVDILRVSNGYPARVSFDAYPGITFPARVTETGKTADPYTGTFEAELSLEPGGRELVSGLIARADILPPLTDRCLMLPVDVLVDADGLTGWLFVANDSVAMKRKVSIRRVDAMICVTDGLKEGERVVVEGAHYLRNGDRIQIVSPE